MRPSPVSCAPAANWRSSLEAGEMVKRASSPGLSLTAPLYSLKRRNIWRRRPVGAGRRATGRQRQHVTHSPADASGEVLLWMQVSSQSLPSPLLRSQSPRPIEWDGLVSKLHRNSAYRRRRATLISALDTSGVTDKDPVLAQSCRTRSVRIVTLRAPTKSAWRV